MTEKDDDRPQPLRPEDPAEKGKPGEDAPAPEEKAGTRKTPPRP